MCTVTYLPRPQGFILSHNRDEAPARSPHSIVRDKNILGDAMIFPRDTKAGGTWIATSRQGRTACLLNGAFVLHTRQLPYRLSRGIILLDFFNWERPEAFFQSYELDRIEPFTFLYFEKSEDVSSVRLITELRWDGQQRYLKNLDPQIPHFWCSATLYPPEMQLRREQVFRHWLPPDPLSPNPQITTRQITQLHLTGSVNDPENDYVMNRAGKVQTVSLTQVIVDEKNARMRYFDLLDGNHSERRLRFNQRTAFSVNR